MEQYLDLVREVLADGSRKENRTGVDTISTFNVNYEIDLRKGFPLLTTKEVSWKNIVIENLWFLSGDTDISILKKHNCKFWDAWVDPDGRVPSAYGNFWRHFPVEKDGRLDFNDQIAWLLDELQRNPNSRRMVATAWAPGNAQTSKLPPCHCMFVLNVQRLPGDDDPVLCLHLTQRSCDVALGVPYNIAGYAFLLELFSRFSGIKAGIFAHTLIDAHIYTCKADGSGAEFDHVPGLKLQLARKPLALPRLFIDPSIRTFSDLNGLVDRPTDDLLKLFRVDGYSSHPKIDFKVVV